MSAFYYLALNHLTMSLNVAFLPYINIPTRYILAESQAKNQDDNARDIRLVTICQTGGSNASLTGITMGENKGMMLLHTAIELLGELMAAMEI